MCVLLDYVKEQSPLVTNCSYHTLPEGGERRRLNSIAFVQIIRTSILVVTAVNIGVVTCVVWKEEENTASISKAKYPH